MRTPPERAARRAATIMFFAAGWLPAAWGTRLPAIKDELDLSAGALALGILGLEAGAVLGLPAGAEAAAPACVIVRGAGGVRAAIEVDEIAGDREVIVKELGPPLVRVRHVAGAGLLRAGTLVLILRPSDLVESVREGRLTAAEPEPEPENGGPPSVLVVDDALTTRTMQRSLLEAAGYRVAVAVDGADAWETLEHEDFDLVVSDVDMPRMDGFELTTRIRADARLADLPVVLVSALETREDKERGIRVGANGYVAKSSFDRSTLLDLIRRLGVKPGGDGR
jgi:two-component system chemotaxis sensor kinase CheA